MKPARTPSSRHSNTLVRSAKLATASAALALLAACGGGSDGPDLPAQCALSEQKLWLDGYLFDEYLWYPLLKNPDPAAFTTIDDYFYAKLSTGGTIGGATFPSDKWSYTERSADFNLFFGEGRTLGYGLSVAGMEVFGQPQRPLRVRYVEPASPAAGQVARGETLVSINGVPASEYIARDDYGFLSPSAAGQRLDLKVRNAGGVERSVSLLSAVYTLTPVSQSKVVVTPGGTKLGYLVMKDFISQAQTPMRNAFADFAAQGVRQVVLDLRYNGGGLVSVARDLASRTGSAAINGLPFATLLHSDKRTSKDQVFRFATSVADLGATRVYVLTGPRTCSASELVINGLEGVNVPVVQIGDTTCGKPVGFEPVEVCGTVFSAVNFETVNAKNQGRYFSGLAPNAGCTIADDLDHPLGDQNEALLAAARRHADTGSCGGATATREHPMAARAAIGRVHDGDRPRMIGR